MYALSVRAPGALARRAAVLGSSQSATGSTIWSKRQRAFPTSEKGASRALISGQISTSATCSHRISPSSAQNRSHLNHTSFRAPFRTPLSYSSLAKHSNEGAFSQIRMASNTATVATEDYVQGEVLDGGLAVITLARPKALNAMNLDMDRTYTHLLDSWQKDTAIKAVLVQGSTPRAFCSGADVKWFATAIREDPGTSLVEKVFNQEYPLVVRIARYPKPYISLMDGITMGFGLGLSAHGRYRVITERTVVAMPENGIGLFPDVGFAHLVGRGPRGLGTYMALTGARLKSPADIFYAGLASHYVPSEKLPDLKADLQSAVRDSAGDAHTAVESVLDRFASAPGDDASLKHVQPFIERVFGAGHPVTRIRDELERAESSSDSKEAEWATEALAGLRRGGPVSLAVTQRHFDAVANDSRRGSGDLSTIEGVMRLEYRLALRTSRRPDFAEGVRAVLIDKDQKPRWQPPSIDEVKSEDVDACFAPFNSPQDELRV